MIHHLNSTKMVSVLVRVCVSVDVYLQWAEEDEDVGHDNRERHQDATQPRQSKDR